MSITKNRVIIAFVAAFFVTGLGHMIVGYVKRGVVILVVAIAIAITGFVLFPGYFVLLITLPYWGWHIYDLYKLAGKGLSKKEGFEKGW
jgi:TM2 domain-containing membrane protein YozV